MKNTNLNRRYFLKSILSTCPVFCYASPKLFASDPQENNHKFKIKSDMSFEELFRFTYTQNFIPIMKNLSSAIGEEKFISMLQEASNKDTKESVKKLTSNFEKKDLATFTEQMRNPDHFMKNVLSFDIIENADSVFEIEIHECLWAKTFKESNASNIGFSCICYPDFAATQAFNPKMKLIRTKTLMQGHDCCNHRWIMEK